jgi:SAM-dependent methyltransferase
MKILDIGCGPNNQKNTIGLDIVQHGNVDIIHDLNMFPYPFDDNEFDEVICYNVLEHLDNVIKTMEEVHRISKPNSTVRITVPTPSSFDLWNDFTHKRAFTSKCFDYFVRGTALFKQNVNQTSFEVVKSEFEKGVHRKYWWDRLLVRGANRYKQLYERRLMYIFQIHFIYFELKVVKQ